MPQAGSSIGKSSLARLQGVGDPFIQPPDARMKGPPLKSYPAVEAS
jgi:hypothetical protein